MDEKGMARLKGIIEDKMNKKSGAKLGMRIHELVRLWHKNRAEPTRIIMNSLTLVRLKEECKGMLDFARPVQWQITTYMGLKIMINENLNDDIIILGRRENEKDEDEALGLI